MEKWIEIRKGGNFMEMAKKYGIDPLIARIIRNRDIIDESILMKKKLQNICMVEKRHYIILIY